MTTSARIEKMRSTAGTGYTWKNRRNDPDRLVLHKFEPVARRHVEFREER